MLSHSSVGLVVLDRDRSRPGRTWDGAMRQEAIIRRLLYRPPDVRGFSLVGLVVGGRCPTLTVSIYQCLLVALVGTSVEVGETPWTSKVILVLVVAC